MRSGSDIGAGLTGSRLGEVVLVVDPDIYVIFVWVYCGLLTTGLGQTCVPIKLAQAASKDKLFL